MSEPVGTNRVEINCPPGKPAYYATVKVDGHLLPCSRAVLTLDADGLPILEVVLPVLGGHDAEVDGRLAFAAESRAALVAAGWTPPPESAA